MMSVLSKYGCRWRVLLPDSCDFLSSLPFFPFSFFSSLPSSSKRPNPAPPEPPAPPGCSSAAPVRSNTLSKKSYMLSFARVTLTSSFHSSSSSTGPGVPEIPEALNAPPGVPGCDVEADNEGVCPKIAPPEDSARSSKLCNLLTLAPLADLRSSACARLSQCVANAPFAMKNTRRRERRRRASF
jgi:hypothetical protein